MIKQTPGKIFLSYQRGQIQTPQLNRYSTLNFEQNFDEHKTQVGNLYAVNEETVGGFQTVEYRAPRASHVILIPVTGALDFIFHNGSLATVDVEELFVYTIPANCTFEIRNPYPVQSISYLQLWVSAEEPEVKPRARVFGFEFTALENILLELVPGTSQATNLPFSLHLGRFNGRKEATYRLKNKSSQFFAFVLSGAFEVEGRLLHEKDSLALWDLEEVEIEALSYNALMLVLEVANSALL
ncbi:pirin family protein [Telluribacter humicola]|uniref:pirin family protein n=1 Tax=Telluribacter humicola TaxID=1720261 RepID=UPI001A95C2E9|nr:hypothetical protein [Telluribacter humicola]